jgi:hypothetical protein
MDAPHTATAHYTYTPPPPPPPPPPPHPVGGFSIALASNVSNSQLTAYATLIAFFGLVLVAIRRKRK